MKPSDSVLRFATITIALIALTACSAYKLVEAGPQTIGSSYTVEIPSHWNAWDRPRSEHVELWTMDGLALQQIRFYHGIGPGNTLRIAERPEQGKIPRYEIGMRANDVVRMLTDTLELYGNSNIEVDTLEPTQFADQRGFRFSLGYTSASGLEYRGLGLGAIDAQDRLDLIVYLGTREHYFEAYRSEVERLFASVTRL